jgi:hypothetical protein
VPLVPGRENGRNSASTVRSMTSEMAVEDGRASVASSVARSGAKGRGGSRSRAQTALPVAPSVTLPVIMSPLPDGTHLRLALQNLARVRVSVLISTALLPILMFYIHAASVHRASMAMGSWVPSCTSARFQALQQTDTVHVRQ